MIPSAGHLFYVADVSRPVLSDTDHHHAARVLRCRVGEEVTVCDGAGRWRRCRWDDGGLVVVGEAVSETAPPELRCVAFSPVKGAKPEFVVQKLTELGVERIVVLSTDRSVVRHDATRWARLAERLVAVAREAGMQSRRAFLPSIEVGVEFSEFVAAMPAVVLADRGGRALSWSDRCIAIGPEGGWSDEERARVTDRVSLAEGVLRAETAAIAAGVLMGVRPCASRNRGG